jgi:hypothetical protein
MGILDLMLKKIERPPIGVYSAWLCREDCKNNTPLPPAFNLGWWLVKYSQLSPGTQKSQTYTREYPKAVSPV